MPARNGFSELAKLIFKNSKDERNLKEVLTSKYSKNDLIDYLQNDDPLIGRAAATALGLIGGMDVVPALVDSLKNDDIPTCFNSEIALWNIWSRSGDESVDKMLNAGRISLKDKDIFEAVEQFTSVIEAARI